MWRAEAESLGIDEALGFGYGEHLLVWGWRRLADGRRDCPVLAREFTEAFGEDAAEVLATLAVFLRVLGRGSRKRLVVGPACCLALTADERQVLNLVAAALNGHEAAFEANLVWLVRSEFHPALGVGARALASAFALHGLSLELVSR